MGNIHNILHEDFIFERTEYYNKRFRMFEYEILPELDFEKQ